MTAVFIPAASVMTLWGEATAAEEEEEGLWWTSGSLHLRSGTWRSSHEDVEGVTGFDPTVAGGTLAAEMRDGSLFVRYGKS